MTSEHPPSRPTVRPSDRPTEGRLMGVDWGERRIWLALSDETQTLAQPLTTPTRRTGKRFPMAQLVALVNRRRVTGIIARPPLDETGAGGDGGHAGKAVAEDVQRRAGG